MQAVNLFLLTRQPNHETISSLYQALTCSEYYKAISPHEAASLCMLTNLLADRIRFSPEHPANWAASFDGFFFSYHTDRGYQLITKLFGREREDTVIAQEYYKVIMVLNENCYYDDSSRLCVTEQSSMTIRLLYEGFSRTREKLALVVAGNRKLYEQLLSIRLHRLPFVDGFT